MSDRVIVPGKGPPCPRCGRWTQIREHREITARELDKPFYYRRWFCCIDKRCKTTLIMADEFRVYTTANERERSSAFAVVWGDGMAWDDVEAQS